MDFVTIGLNPELPGYRTECRTCGAAATFRDFLAASNRCGTCGGKDVEFWVPRTYEAWRQDGAAGNVRGFVDRRLDIKRIEEHIGRPVNFANARLSPWPSANEKTIQFGARAGEHLLDFLAATRPQAVLVYSTAPWRLLQERLVTKALAKRETFVTSGGRNHWGESFGLTPANHRGVGWEMAGVAISQAQDANYASNDGKTRREWAADQLAVALA